MLEIVRTQRQTFPVSPISQPACEVTQFMNNFFEAARGGDLEEVSTYYSDEMEEFRFQLGADWSDETLVVDDHLATFCCKLSTDENPEQRLTCVLDKSEGYWQIIHAEIQNNQRCH